MMAAEADQKKLAVAYPGDVLKRKAALIRPSAGHVSEAHSGDRLPDAYGPWHEPKWNGFRGLAFKVGNRIDLRAKSGRLFS
jgi:ATP-dependent DNA ligase